jgi:general secretion pathway protein C
MAVDTSNPWSDIRTVGEHAYEVPREDVQAAFSQLEDLSTQARVVPAFKEGQARGFKMFAIRPHSLFAKLGLQNGDVLQRINGLSLSTPETAITAFQSLREARHVEVDLERGGAPVRKTYDVR